MNLGELFQKLSFTHLSSLAIGGEGSGIIPEKYHAKLASHTSSALTAIYSRVSHKRDYVKFTTSAGKQRYPLIVGEDHIVDTLEEPFFGNIIKIIQVRREDDPATDEDETETIRINSGRREPRVEILSHAELFFPTVIDGATYVVEYQADHEPLSVPLDFEQPIHVVPLLEEALILRVAANVFSGMTGEAHMAKSQELGSLYEKLMQLTKMEDLTQESSFDGYDRLRESGFI